MLMAAQSSEEGPDRMRGCSFREPLMGQQRTDKVASPSIAKASDCQTRSLGPERVEFLLGLGGNRRTGGAGDDAAECPFRSATISGLGQTSALFQDG